MGKYTSDDNRSMQLNPNNDRYYSSRGIDLDDHDNNETVHKSKKEECGYCAHCQQWLTTGSWMPCLFPEETRTKQVVPDPKVEEHGRQEYNRMEYLYSIWQNAVNNDMPYASYKDAKNEYARLKRWLRKNTHDLHEQLWWEY